jgi:hypothetical protein
MNYNPTKKQYVYLAIILLVISLLLYGCNKTDEIQRASKQLSDSGPVLPITASGAGPFMLQGLPYSDPGSRIESLASGQGLAPGYEREQLRRRDLLQYSHNKHSNTYLLFGGRTRLCNETKCYDLIGDWYNEGSLQIPTAGRYSWDDWTYEMEWLLEYGVEIRVLLLDAADYQNVRFVPLSADEINKLESLRLRYPKLRLIHDR